MTYARFWNNVGKVIEKHRRNTSAWQFCIRFEDGDIEPISRVFKNTNHDRRIMLGALDALGPHPDIPEDGKMVLRRRPLRRPWFIRGGFSFRH